MLSCYVKSLDHILGPVTHLPLNRTGHQMVLVVVSTNAIGHRTIAVDIS